MCLSSQLRVVRGLPLKAALALGVFSGGALAQPAAEEPPTPTPPVQAGPETAPEPAPAETTDPNETRAQAHVLLFVGPRPAGGVTVSAGDAEPVTTTDSGSAMLSLGVSGSYPVRLVFPRELVPKAPGEGPVTVDLESVQFVVGETIEAIATVDETGKVIALDVEGAGERAQERAEAEAQQKAQASKPKGKLVGTVVAAETREPVADARVFVRGETMETVTDAQGRFTLELPEGSYEISAIHPDYSTELERDVPVKGKEQSTVTLELTPASVELDDFVITAPHVEGGVAALMEERRESSNVTDVIGAEEMSRAGASDAAGAVTRITGINVQGGKIVYVRGMGERYSATLLNGQMIPSPDPERRVVPLDLFPTQILESVVVQKTFSPDLPAEFGGGMVQLRTRSYPDGPTLQVSGQVGANTQTTFGNNLTYQGGSTDWLGVDDGTRALPEEVRAGGTLDEETRFSDGYTQEELGDLGRTFPNIWNLDRQRTPVDRKVTLTGGHKFDFGDQEFGFLVAGVYGDKYREEVSEINRYNLSGEGGALERAYSQRIEDLTRTVSTGLIGAVGAEYWPGQHIKSTTMLLRVTDMASSIVTGEDKESPDRQTRFYRLRWIERQLFTEQVTGEQHIKPLNEADLDWRYAYSVATQDDPDRREYPYTDARADPPPDFTLGEQTRRKYGELVDTIHNVGVDYTQPFPIWSKLEAKGKLGTMFVDRAREAETLRYSFRAPGGGLVPAPVTRQTAEDIFDPGNWGPDGWVPRNASKATDKYTAEQEIVAGYLMAEVPVVEQVEVSGGARVEKSVQTVTTENPFGTKDEEPVVAELDNTDWLPGVTATWRFRDDMLVRGAYGKTVSRPDFRELSPASFLDVTTNIEYIGNPELERAIIQNYDTRYEWYFTTDESISLGGFYKYFDQPIEIAQLGGAGTRYSWKNAQSATNWGLEFEGRTRLGWAARALEDFFLATNVAYIKSQVKLAENEMILTSKERPLQGQAPYVINAQFGYDDTNSADGIGLVATLLYNVTGPYIEQVGGNGLPDIYLEPVHGLDFTFALELPGGFSLNGKAQNLLNWEYVFTQGEEVFQASRKGQSFTLGLAWSL